MVKNYGLWSSKKKVKMWEASLVKGSMDANPLPNPLELY